MDSSDFRAYAHQVADRMADYFENVEEYPVKPNVEPGSIFAKLPGHPPMDSESMDDILQDFEDIIMPGMTHWESPRFMAYFPANKSYASVLAEMLTATLGAQCMSWITSPAATELEEQMMIWLRDMIGLPAHFTGVIQDTASTATLSALLMAREKVSNFAINESGFPAGERYTIYCSSETHSSIEKDVKIAGFGKRNLRKVDVNDDFSMRPEALEKAIHDDVDQGYKPTCVIATIGTTGSTAIDPLNEIAEICDRYNIFLHVDAAYAGTALLLPNMRWMIDGIESVDSFVFNPHKWMFTNFDCSAFFVRDEEQLVRTFEITPEYLKTPEDQRVKNYRDWGIQLGRRFRALKLWFVIRNFGMKGLREKIQHHLDIAESFAQRIRESAAFELLAPVPLNTICFRYHPPSVDDEEKLNKLNEKLLDAIQNEGRFFLTHTKLNGQFTIRVVLGNTRLEQHHADELWSYLQKSIQTLGTTD